MLGFFITFMIFMDGEDAADALMALLAFTDFMAFMDCMACMDFMAFDTRLTARCGVALIYALATIVSKSTEQLNRWHVQ